MKELSSYENKQLELIKEWENKPVDSSLLGDIFDFVTSPVQAAVNIIVPASAIEGAINGANSVAKFLADEGDICRDAGVDRIEELRGKSLELSDKLADSVQNWAIGFGVAEGAATGSGGVTTLVVDIPALITLTLRTIHKIGLCYGYRADTLEEKQYVLDIMSLTSATSNKEKAASLAALAAVKETLIKKTIKEIEEKAVENKITEEGFILAIKALAKKLGITLTKRKMGQLIPLVGGAVGAAINGNYIRDISYAALRQYQKRWLEENRLGEECSE